jgi:hypothetical protein
MNNNKRMKLMINLYINLYQIGSKIEMIINNLDLKVKNYKMWIQ